jgi:hypothetical protein
MTKRKTLEPEQERTLEQRRSFLKLPIGERRERMDEQAARMVPHYEAAGEVSEREQWQGGDLVEFS